MNFIDNCLKFCIFAAVLGGGMGSALAGWSVSSDPELGQGQVAIISGSQVNITGPTGDFFPSFDSATFTTTYMPAGGQYTVSFHLDYNGGVPDSAQASFYWPTVPGGNPVAFASGSETKSGDYSFIVNNGQGIEFMLDSQTGDGKAPPTFNIRDFSAVYSVPDVTPWIDAAVFVPLLARRFWPRGRGQQRDQ